MENALDTIAPQALDLLTSTVDRLSPGDYRRMSNLRGWTVRDLVAHVTGSVHRAGDLVEGLPVDRPRSEPSDWYADDQAAALQAEADRFLAVLPDAELGASRPSPMGEVPLERALAFPVVDVIVHAWDLQRSVGRRLQLEEPLLSYVQGVVTAMGDATEDNPHFDPPQPVEASATPTEQVMARLGRATGMMAS